MGTVKSEHTDMKHTGNIREYTLKKTQKKDAELPENLLV